MYAVGTLQVDDAPTYSGSESSDWEKNATEVQVKKHEILLVQNN